MAFNLNSKEFFINMDKKDIPPKNHPDYLALRDIETIKCKDGVTINGIYIWGSLYYHLNHHYLDVDKIDNRGIISTVIERPGFRDNEWLIHEAYNECYDSKLGFAMMSARQLSKTSLLVSLVTRQLFLYPNSEVLGLFSSKPDKQSFTKKLQISLQHNTDFLVVPNIDKDLNKEYIRFGITEKDNEPYVYSKLYMYLTEGGVNSEVGAGKALKHGSKVFYENKEGNIENCKVGDKIFGVDGKLTTITGVYPQGVVDLYKLTFSDGRTIECCGEHLWKVIDKGNKVHIKNTKSLFNKLTKSNPFYVEFTKPLEYSEKQFLIPPYILGYHLGDGDSNGGRFCSIDKEPIIEYKKKYEVNDLGDNIHYYAKKLISDWKKLNLYKNKHIPEEYFYGSVEQRIELLSGLFDSDGGVNTTCSKNKKLKSVTVFTNTNIHLIEGVKRLLGSLGIGFTCHKRNRSRYGVPSKTSFDILVRSDINIFKIKRKSEKIIKRLTNFKRTPIKSIEKINSDYATCISVDNKDKLFLTTDFIPTHNTISMFFSDEFAKTDIIEAYEAIIPAIRSAHGLRCSPIMTGCVCEGTKIITNGGKFINIENLQKQQGIVGYNGLNAVKQLITHINPPQEKECVRIETEGGEYIECSTDHPFLMSFPHFENKLNNTRRKKVTFKRADSLKKGDQLCLIKDIPIFGEYENCNARLLGMLIGDGYYGKGGASIGGADFELHNFIEKNYDFKLQSNKGFTTKTGLDYKHYYIRKSGKILKDAGINFQTKLEKRLPTNIETYTKESLAELLGGYYDADGNVNIRKDKKAMRIVLTSVVEELLKEVKQQLLKFGITSNIVKENRVFKKREFINSTNHIFRLYISNINSIRIFHKEIKFLIEHKQNNLNFVTQLKIKGHKHNNLCTFVEGFKGDYFKGMTNLENIRFQSVKTVVNIGKKPVYNLTASDTHTYIANGFITHNTGGNVEKSKDAESMFFNPDAYYFKSFKNEGRDTGFFMGGTYRSDFKKPALFTDWYNERYSKKEPTSELDELTFKISDTKLANTVLDEEEKTAKSVSLSAYQKRKMYAPRSLTDMFLKTNSNPFAHLTDEFEQLLVYLEAEESRQGKAVDLVGNEVSGVTFNYSDKPVLKDYPVSKNDDWKKDSAVVILDPPRLQHNTKLYVMGLDPFNMIKASKEASLASFYIMRRETSDFSDPFGGRIVAWYNGRKDISHSRKIILQSLVLYGGLEGGCTLLHEASDDSLTQWFNEKNLGYLLEDSYALSREINPNSQVSNLKGMRPTVRNQNYYLGKILDYCEEVMPDGRLGLWRIPDPFLIKQLLMFSGDIGVCFIKDTQIFTETGYKNIQDICIGEKVLTHTGKFKAVKRTYKTYYVDNLCKVEFKGSEKTLTCTKNHPFLTKQVKPKWKKITFQQNKEDYLTNISWKEAEALTKKDFLLSPKITELLPKELCDDALYLLGWYLSDGYVTKKGRLRISFQGDQLHIAEYIKSILEKHEEFTPVYFKSTHWMTGKKFISHTKRVLPRIFPMSGGEYGYNLECTSHWLKDIIDKYITIKPGGEKEMLPNLYLQKDLNSLILGFFEGDGSLYNNIYKGANRYTLTVNGVYKNLLTQIYQILLNLNFTVIRRNVDCSKKQNSRDQTCISLTNTKEINILTKNSLKFPQIPEIPHKQVIIRADEGLYGNVKKVTFLEKKEIEVYNIEVDEDNSYVAEGVAVHNCDSIASFGHTLMHYYKERRYLPQIYGNIKPKPKQAKISNAFGFTNNSSKSNKSFSII